MGSERDRTSGCCDLRPQRHQWPVRRLGRLCTARRDGLDYIIREGLPEPTTTSAAPAGLQILALGMSSLKEERSSVPLDDRFLSDDDAKYVAEMRLGDSSDAAVDRVKRGAGMIVNFARGRGEVFHAGSCEWVAALLRRDPMVERVTGNVLARYLGR